MTLGLSVPGQSLLHRLPAGAKMAALLIASLALFLTNSLVVVLASVPVGFAVYLSTGVPLKGLIADLRGPAVIIVAILLFQCLFGSPAEGGLAAARFATLILIAGAVTLSTPVSAMADLVEWLLRPLRPIGINPEKVGLAIALAIRFVPMITQEFHLVREAQSARGLGRNPVALVVPLVIRTLKAADELADAIEARGYDA